MTPYNKSKEYAVQALAFEASKAEQLTKTISECKKKLGNRATRRNAMKRIKRANKKKGLR